MKINSLSNVKFLSEKIKKKKKSELIFRNHLYLNLTCKKRNKTWNWFESKYDADSWIWTLSLEKTRANHIQNKFICSVGFGQNQTIQPTAMLEACLPNLWFLMEDFSFFGLPSALHAEDKNLPVFMFHFKWLKRISFFF